MTGLQEKLEKRQFVVTAELQPPRGADVTTFLEKARLLKGLVDAVNVTDNQRSIMRLSSIVASSLLLKEGLEPIFQMTCRDRNRIALQSDLLGAHVLGLRNVLALTGDDISSGDHEQAKSVFDLEATGLLRMVQQLNNGQNSNESPLEGKTSFYAGAVVNPCAEPLELQILRMEQKIMTGARFFQTQAVFDLEKYTQFVSALSDEKISLLVGILVLKSAKMARFINANVPGVEVPEKFIIELEHASDPIEKGKEIAVRLIEAVRELAGGVHVMSVGKEEMTRDVLEQVQKNEK